MLFSICPLCVQFRLLQRSAVIMNMQAQSQCLILMLKYSTGASYTVCHSFQLSLAAAHFADCRTAFKHPNVYQTLHVFYFCSGQARYLVRQFYNFFSFWTNKLRFLANLSPIVKSELNITENTEN